VKLQNHDLSIIDLTLTSKNSFEEKRRLKLPHVGGDVDILRKNLGAFG